MNDMPHRWGTEDEIGALNLIGPAEVCRAAALVGQGRVFSLAQQISRDMIVAAHRPGVMHFMNRDGGDYAAGRKSRGGFQMAEDTVVMPLHLGTHFDALCHCWYDDTLYNGFSANDVRSDGARRCGIDKMPPIVTRGVLLDAVRVTGSPLTGGFTISAALLKECLSEAGTDLLPGDAVLIRTGWLESQKRGENPDYNTEPGLGIEAATLLADADVAVIGADNYAVEALPFPEGQVFPVHQKLIRDCGIPLMEGLVLEPLGSAGAKTFLFMAAPLPVKGGTGSPVNPVAVL
ncbi:MAG: cyclase family protein [Rhodobiaceae bacterium]|nr:cyclase family protein [Rhodobiaceae bacterium]MCC0056249.1 cyclase family protein [Rhodobiaceae bacterium]